MSQFTNYNPPEESKRPEGTCTIQRAQKSFKEQLLLVQFKQNALEKFYMFHSAYILLFSLHSNLSKTSTQKN